MSMIISIILALQLMGGAFTQNNAQKNMNQNEWQLLNWGSNITEVQAFLDEMGYDWTIGEKQIELQREDKRLETMLWFSDQERLIRVTEVRKFNLNEKKDADAYFQQFREDFEERFGTAVREDDDTERELITLEWDAGSTRIVCRYDYKRKFIDEFGMDSFRIEVVYAPSRE